MFRRGDHSVPGVWSVHQEREIVQGGPLGLGLSDPALDSNGAGPCNPSLWD